MANDTTRRRKTTGRSAATYLGVPHYVFRSAEFGELDGWELKLLIELAGKYTGFNNGDLSCAFSQLKHRGWRSSGTRQKALNGLLARSWIIATRTGSRNRCALYAVTWWPIDPCEGKGLEVRATATASNSWQKTKSVVAMRTNVVAMRTEEASERGQK
ncbi:hypothetical protein [Aerolutibacter daejeonensis]|uniref:hypothetical protein n=1 Tax=Aerolutibacter daejeonensis TaxID=346181 RepID=UPI0012EBA63C|nr:hypothetical protein [Lysobacter daejeonensis]